MVYVKIDPDFATNPAIDRIHTGKMQDCDLKWDEHPTVI